MTLAARHRPREASRRSRGTTAPSCALISTEGTLSSETVLSIVQFHGRRTALIMAWVRAQPTAMNRPHIHQGESVPPSSVGSFHVGADVMNDVGGLTTTSITTNSIIAMNTEPIHQPMTATG